MSPEQIEVERKAFEADTDELMALADALSSAAFDSGRGANTYVGRHAAAREALRTALEAVVEDAKRKERERIADLWAGCTTEAEGHGLVGIGASIRAGRLVDEP